LNNKIAILLSTYNGEKYLERQLDSILNQSEFQGSYTLFIRDDGSSDATINIISKYTRSHNEIEWLNEYDAKENMGVVQSFFQMLHLIDKRDEYNYFMFCDQDDVWLPNKIRLTIDEAHKHQGSGPLLVHTDLTVVNSGESVLSESFWKYQRINQNRIKLNQLLVQNVVTGCTILINKELVAYINVDLSSTNVVMHDWWLALLACLFGNIKSVNSSTILYRQHESNTLGASKYGITNFYRKLLKKNNDLDLIKQAERLLEVYGPYLDEYQIKMINGFVNCRRNWFIKVFMVVKHGFYKYGLPRNVVWLLRKIK